MGSILDRVLFWMKLTKKAIKRKGILKQCYQQCGHIAVVFPIKKLNNVWMSWASLACLGLELDMLPRPGTRALKQKRSRAREATIDFKWSDVCMCDSQGSLFLVNHEPPFLALQQAVKIAGVKVVRVRRTTVTWTCAECFKTCSDVTLKNYTLAQNSWPLSKFLMKFNRVSQGAF